MKKVIYFKNTLPTSMFIEILHLNVMLNILNINNHSPTILGIASGRSFREIEHYLHQLLLDFQHLISFQIYCVFHDTWAFHCRHASARKVHFFALFISVLSSVFKTIYSFWRISREKQAWLFIISHWHNEV